MARSAVRVVMALAAAGLTACGGKAPAPPPEVMFVLDASSSMMASFDSTAVRGTSSPFVGTSLGAAVQALNQIATDVAGDQALGLTAFGHWHGPEGCWSEVLRRPTRSGAAGLTSSANAILPGPGTPLAEALRLGADSLVAREDAQSTLILLTDSGETCEGDPLKAVRDIRARRTKLSVHVIGFPTDRKSRTYLEALARAGGGSYYSPADTTQLVEALRASIRPSEAKKTNRWLWTSLVVGVALAAVLIRYLEIASRSTRPRRP